MFQKYLFDLNWWIDGLLPILDEFINASKGNTNQEFWKSFYKESGMSGGPYISGHVLKLFPYTSGCKKLYKRNEYLFKPVPVGGGPTIDDFPLGVSSVDCVWNYFGVEFNMQMLSGFMTYTQDVQTLALKPEIGWAILEKLP